MSSAISNAKRGDGAGLLTMVSVAAVGIVMLVLCLASVLLVMLLAQYPYANSTSRLSSPAVLMVMTIILLSLQSSQWN